MIYRFGREGSAAINCLTSEVVFRKTKVIHSGLDMVETSNNHNKHKQGGVRKYASFASK